MDPYAGPTLFGGQHDARVLPDGTIALHDNGTGRSRPPRAVRYRVDEDLGSATLLEDVRDPRIDNSNFAGGARRLPGGHWVVSWGGTPLTTELTKLGKVVFRLKLPDDFYSYRTFPVKRGQVTRAQLRRAMDARYGR